MGKSYGQRPSSLLGLTDGWAAYQLDLATLQLGLAVENKLAEHDKAGKPKHNLTDLLRDEGDETVGPEPEQFRSLAGMAITKMAVPESGVW